MTINLPDGSKVSEIVLPDGSTASEVIAPDGSVVFSGAPAIPDSGDLHAHYDFSDSSTTTSEVPDLTGNGHDLTGSFTSLNATINGVQAGEFDGTDDLVDTLWTTISQPNSIFAVIQLQSTTATQVIITGDTSTKNQFFVDRSSNWAIYGGTAKGDGAADTNPHIIDEFFKSTDELYIDGSNVVSADAGSLGLEGFQVGADSGDTNYANVYVGEILVYPQDKSGIRADVEAYLSDKWGVAV